MHLNLQVNLSQVNNDKVKIMLYHWGMIYCTIRELDTHMHAHPHTRTQKYIQDVIFHKLENFNLKYCLLLECDIIIQTPLDHKLTDSVVTLHSLFNIELFSDNVEAYTFPTPTPKSPLQMNS